MSRASTSYKKKDGTLTVSGDQKSLLWTPQTGTTPAVTISISHISNLQQTPAASPKIALKVVVQASGTPAPPVENHVFTFPSTSAGRAEQESITDVLRNLISALKSAQNNAPSAPTPAATGAPPQSASMAIAQAVSSSNKATDGWYDDAQLKADTDLKRSLLDANPVLRQRFNESLRDRPASLSASQFGTQFWSTRLHLLRAHAIEKAQSQGDYNVLPEIRFNRVAAEKEGEPDKLMLNLAKEQVKLIFKQHPVVREAYNDNVPQIDQNAFWSRFFTSKLLRRLKGEKITDADASDPVFDKYLDYHEKGPAAMGQVPTFMDLEGNEQNHSQRKGNRPDETMRPGSFEKVPILRILNNLSEKMLSQVAPNDGDAHGPVGMDEDTFNQLQLRDLQAEADDNRVTLNIRDQQRFLAGEQGAQVSADAARYAQQSPQEVLVGMQQDLETAWVGQDSKGSLRLDQAIGVQSDSDDSDDDMDGDDAAKTKKPARVGGKAALTTATTDILTSIRMRRDATSADSATTNGLSQNTFDTLTMTHNTTIEFLHYFWNLFLSGDGSRVKELEKLVETLDKSVDRIKAVADTAESEKAKKVQELKSQMQGTNPKSVKRRRLDHDLDALGGGNKAVEQIVAPTMRALAAATSQYRKAFEEQSALAAAS